MRKRLLRERILSGTWVQMLSFVSYFPILFSIENNFADLENAQRKDSVNGKRRRRKEIGSVRAVTPACALHAKHRLLFPFPRQSKTAAVRPRRFCLLLEGIQLLHMIGPLVKDPPVCVLVPVAHQPQVNHKLFLSACWRLILFPVVSLSVVFLTASHVFLLIRFLILIPFCTFIILSDFVEPDKIMCSFCE